MRCKWEGKQLISHVRLTDHSFRSECNCLQNRAQSTSSTDSGSRRNCTRTKVAHSITDLAESVLWCSGECKTSIAYLYRKLDSWEIEWSLKKVVSTNRKWKERLQPYLLAYRAPTQDISPAFTNIVFGRKLRLCSATWGVATTLPAGLQSAYSRYKPSVHEHVVRDGAMPTTRPAGWALPR
jgi:hypothetical protein